MASAEINWSETLWLAARNDPLAMERLADIAASNPSHCSRLLREFMLSEQHVDEMGTCDLLNLLLQIDGLSTVENWILTEWPRCRTSARRKICYWSYLGNGMPTNLARLLFDHESSSVCDRHLLAAGLAASAVERRAQSLVMQLLPRIGEYGDPVRQNALADFLKSAQKSFAASQCNKP